MALVLGFIETKGLITAVEAADAMLKNAEVEITGRETIPGGIVILKITGELASVKNALETGAEAARRVGQVISVNVIAKPVGGLNEILPEINEKSRKNRVKISKKLPKKEKVKEETFSLFDQLEEEEIQEENITDTKTEDTPKKEDDLFAINNEPEKVEVPEEIEEDPKEISVVPEPEPVIEQIVEPEKPVEELPIIDNDKEKELQAAESIPEVTVIEKEEPSVSVNVEKEIDTELSVTDEQPEQAVVQQIVSEGIEIKEQTGEVSDNEEKTDIEKMNVHELRKLARSIPGFPIQGRQISKANRTVLLDFLQKLPKQ